MELKKCCTKGLLYSEARSSPHLVRDIYITALALLCLNKYTSNEYLPSARVPPEQMNRVCSITAILVATSWLGACLFPYRWMQRNSPLRLPSLRWIWFISIGWNATIIIGYLSAEYPEVGPNSSRHSTRWRNRWILGFHLSSGKAEVALVTKSLHRNCTCDLSPGL